MHDTVIHPQALCESANIGSRTRIWAFTHVLPGARIGADCNICDGVFIENEVVIGDRVTIKPGVQLWNGVTLSDDVFVGPNATFTNDPMPRSRQWLDSYPTTLVHKEASIGANATILPGLEIGRGAMVGAGAVVTRSVPPNAIVAGNPARIMGYTETTSSTQPGPGILTELGEPGRSELNVRGVYVQQFPAFSDLRGRLTAGELPGEQVPFIPRRWFFVHDVPTREVRGEHAHRICEQFLICVSGSVTVAVDDGKCRTEVVLNDLTLGIYIPPLVWASEFRYEAGAILLVLASHPYDPNDYIREYDLFLEAVEQSPL